MVWARTDLDEGGVEELELLLSEVCEVPETECAAVVDAAGDEGGAGEEMELADAVDGGFGLERTFRVFGIKPDRKRLCSVPPESEQR